MEVRKRRQNIALNPDVLPSLPNLHGVADGNQRILGLGQTNNLPQVLLQPVVWTGLHIAGAALCGSGAPRRRNRLVKRVVIHDLNVRNWDVLAVSRLAAEVALALVLAIAHRRRPLVLKLEAYHDGATRELGWTNVHHLAYPGRALNLGAIAHVDPLRVDSCELFLACRSAGGRARGRRLPHLVGRRCAVADLGSFAHAHLALLLLLLLPPATLLRFLQPVRSRGRRLGRRCPDFWVLFVVPGAARAQENLRVSERCQLTRNVPASCERASGAANGAAGYLRTEHPPRD